MNILSVSGPREEIILKYSLINFEHISGTKSMECMSRQDGF